MTWEPESEAQGWDPEICFNKLSNDYHTCSSVRATEVMVLKVAPGNFIFMNLK
jgi:hypothetical protein